MRLILALGLLSLSYGVSFGTEIYRDDVRQFRMTIAAGWYRLTPEELRSANERFSKAQLGNMKLQFFAGYWNSDPTLTGCPSLLLLHESQQNDNMTYGQCEKALHSLTGKPATQQFDRFPADLRIVHENAVGIDRFRNQFAITGYDPDSKQRVLCVGHLGARRTISVFGMMPESQVEKNQAAIRAASDSLTFDADAVFHPAPEEEKPQRSETPGQSYDRIVQHFGLALIGVSIMALLGGLFFIFIVWQLLATSKLRVRTDHHERSRF